MITGGHTMVAQDIPPYVKVTGNRAQLYGLNKVGMERAGYSKKDMDEMRRAYKIFFRSRLTAVEALKRLDAEFPHASTVKSFSAFIRQSQRGICR